MNVSTRGLADSEVPFQYVIKMEVRSQLDAVFEVRQLNPISATTNFGASSYATCLCPPGSGALLRDGDHGECCMGQC